MSQKNVPELEALNVDPTKVEIVDDDATPTVSMPVQLLKDMMAFKSTLIIIFVPLIACPLLFLDSPQAKCAWVVIVMGSYWMFEVMPLAVTAMLPTFLFPMLGVLSASDTCQKYLSQINFLFIGGLIMALAVEKCNLHERIALRVMTVVGSQPKWIMLGFMAVTAFLSMWMSNTATTAMMVPIAQSVVMQLVGQSETKPRSGSKLRTQPSVEPSVGKSGENLPLSPMTEVTGDFDDGEGVINLQQSDSKPQIDNMRRRRKHSKSVDEGMVHPPTADKAQASELNLDTMSPKDRLMAKGLLISIAFAANIGGTGTITGTPPNLVLVDQFDSIFPKAAGLISFLGWMQFALPLMAIATLICWLVLAIVFLDTRDILNTVNPVAWYRSCRNKDKKEKGPDPVSEMINSRYNNLPKMSFAEWAVLLLFSLLLALWIFRDPKVIPGFGQFFKKKYYTDSTSAMFVSVILFMFPDQMPDWLCLRSRQKTKPTNRGALMDWPTMQHKFPWSVVLLLGGGFALAEGVSKSGLSNAIGDVLRTFEEFETIWLQLACIIITMFVTNICSNTVTAVIFLQIVATMAQNIQAHPLLFMLPTTLACSYAFLLPVATPPNAIVFASGLLTVGDLMKAGGVMSIISILIILLHTISWATLFWPLATFPVWAGGSPNATVSPIDTSLWL